MISGKHYGLNEGSWSNIFLPKSTKAKLMSAVLKLGGVTHKVIDNELFTTPHAGIPWVDGTYEYPDYWLYENGELKAIKNHVELEVPYIHFMNWKSGTKYLPSVYDKPLWDGVDLTRCRSIWRELRIKIDQEGFSLI